MASAKTKRKTAAAKPPEVSTCAASAVGADQTPPLDRPEWLIGSTSAALIKDALGALCAPHRVPKSEFIDVTVDGTDIRLIVLPPHELGTYETWQKRIEAWKAARQPLLNARREKVVGGIHVVPVPTNLSKIPTEDVGLLGGWLRMISKSVPGLDTVDPRGFIRVFTTKAEFPEGMGRGRTWWTTYYASRLVLSTGKGRNDIWRQILDVARAP